MRNKVAKMLMESVKGGDPLDAEWFWEAGMASAKEGTPLDIVIWDAVREILAEYSSDGSMAEAIDEMQVAAGSKYA